MRDSISFDYKNAYLFMEEHEMNKLESNIKKYHDYIHYKTGAGSQFLGWVDLPIQYDRKEFVRIQQVAQKIQEDSEVLIVVGIGGSYLGSRAAIKMLTHSFYNQLPSTKRKKPIVYFAGHHLSSNYMTHLFEILSDNKISINVISKSGETIETMIAFRLLRNFMEKHYGKEETRKRIYVTTDDSNGALRCLARAEGYETFSFPKDVNGRNAVLTSVGLLPMAVVGIDIVEVMEGAQTAWQVYGNPNLGQNHCYQYAVVRNILYNQGKTIELLASYNPKLIYFSEWWKLLFAESEGKDQKGIFPATVQFTTDLHSMGQYIQDGLRNIFETVIMVEQSNDNLALHYEIDDVDGLNYLAEKNLEFINDQAFKGTLRAHVDGGIPNLLVKVTQLSPYTFGQLVYFFQKACAISGYLLGVNPFHQPGVEVYKTNLFSLLRK